jgi:hypothetical protein
MPERDCHVCFGLGACILPNWRVADLGCMPTTQEISQGLPIFEFVFVREFGQFASQPLHLLGIAQQHLGNTGMPQSVK